jgi:hypothetical protein
LSTTYPRSIPRREALAAAVGLTLLAVGGIAPAHAQAVTPPAPPCDQISGISGSIVTCSGNLSGGVDLQNVAGPFEVLNVINLTTNIAPASGTTGILFTSDGSVELNVATGPFAIFTTAANGIIAASNTSTVIVLSTADITTAGGGAAGIAASGATGTAVISTGNIRTYGDNAPAIAVMSNGDVAVSSNGNITTTGVASDGISATSVSGMVAVVNTGDISATGPSSAGIYAAGDTGALVMNYGSVVGGPCCAGVMMDSNTSNTLLNWGKITAGLADYAIDIMAPANAVENFGTVTGDVRLFDGFGSAGSFINHAEGLFNSGNNVRAVSVVNDGTIAPGGRGTVLTTMMSDNYSQGAGGTYEVDVDGATVDEMIVSSTADLAGTVHVNFLSLPALTTYTILQAGSLTDNGLGLIASPALHAQLQFNGNNLDLVFAVDFKTDGLNRNQRAIAGSLHGGYTLGAGALSPVLLGLLNVQSLGEYKGALDQLLPAIYSDAEITAPYSSLAFSNSLLSCKVNGAGTAAIIREGQCLWAGASATFLDTGTTVDQIGFTQAAGLFNAGAQVALDDVWRVGFGAGYQSSSLQTATNAESEGAMAQAGVSVKYNPGPLLLAGVINGGGAWYDTTRPMAFGGFTGVAEGDQNIGIISGALRAAYVLGSPHLYYKPILDLGLTHLELGGFTESGGGGAALAVAGGSQTVFTLAPTLEVGSEWRLANGTLIRPLIRGGGIWYDGADFALTASFAGAPVGASPFTINTDIDEVMGLVGAGLEVINGGDAVLRFNYDGQLGETTQIHTVGIKGSARF